MTSEWGSERKPVSERSRNKGTRWLELHLVQGQRKLWPQAGNNVSEHDEKRICVGMAVRPEPKTYKPTVRGKHKEGLRVREV